MLGERSFRHIPSWDHGENCVSISSVVAGLLLRKKQLEQLGVLEVPAEPAHANLIEVGVAGAGVEAEGVMKGVQIETTIETLLRVVGVGRRATSRGCRNLRRDRSPAAGATTMVFVEISRRGTASVVTRASSRMNDELNMMMVALVVPPLSGGTTTSVEAVSASASARYALETGHAQAVVSTSSQGKIPVGSVVLQNTKVVGLWMESSWVTRVVSVGEAAAGTLAGHLGPAGGAKQCVPCCLPAQTVQCRQLI